MDINNDTLCVAHDSDSKDSVNLTIAMLAMYDMAQRNNIGIEMHIYPSNAPVIGLVVYDGHNDQYDVITPDDLSDINVDNFRQQLSNAIHDVTGLPSNVIHKV